MTATPHTPIPDPLLVDAPYVADAVHRDTGADAAATLTAAIASGDTAAFERLYRAHFARMLATARRFTGRDESFCLDVVHDATLRLARTLPIIETDAALHTYIRRCVCRAALDRLRTDARRTARERAAATHNHDGTTHHTAEHIDALRQEIARLQPRDTALLRLRFALGRTLEQIARAERTTPGATHGRTRRALHALRAALRADDERSSP